MTTKSIRLSFSFPNIKSLFWLLFLLCMIDALSTDLGLSTQHITELNPIMNFIYFHLSVLAFYVIKLGLPVVLWFIHHKIRPKILYVGLSIALSLYLGVLLLHAHWIFIVFI